jgi:DNA-binding NarL/FixJ family response regulator
VSEPSDSARRDVVLVVDDSPETLSLLTDALESSGMTVLVATDGSSALERVQRLAPDVILLDAVMPGMDGFETCAALRALPALAAVPILFMTGLTDAEHVVRGFDAGGVDYVTKPIDPEALIARIRSHVANARRMRSTRAGLEASGRALLAVDGQGGVLWHTPRAAGVIRVACVTAGGRPMLQGDALDWIRGIGAGAAITSLPWPVQAPSHTLACLGSVGGGQFLLSVEETVQGAMSRLAQRHQLTDRESEVLLWVARGKSSRDIGEILGASPRTIDKHLEHAFVKLGVENRAAAAALVTRHLAAE